MNEKKRYKVICSECNNVFWAGSSISMEFDENSGHGSCPACKTFLHLSLKTGLEGDEMISMKHDNYIQQLEANLSFLPAGNV